MYRKSTIFTLAAVFFLCLPLFCEAAMSDDDFLALCRTGSPAEILAAVEAGAHPHAQNAQGHTALIAAALSNPDSEVIGALVKAGADVNGTEEHGRTALIFASRTSSNPGVILALLDSGADATMKNLIGRNALDYARQNPGLNGTEAIKALEKATQE